MDICEEHKIMCYRALFMQPQFAEIFRICSVLSVKFYYQAAYLLLTSLTVPSRLLAVTK